MHVDKEEEREEGSARYCNVRTSLDGMAVRLCRRKPERGQVF